MLRWNENDIHKPKCGRTNREKQCATEKKCSMAMFLHTHDNCQFDGVWNESKLENMERKRK